MMFDELKFVDWLSHHTRRRPEISLGIGDDMAVLSPQRGLILVSCDLLLDGVHFDTKKHSLERIGRKALCCGLSDCAAMAVRPIGATIAIAVPSAFGNAEVEKLFRGIFSAADEFDAPIVGGDTTRWAQSLAIDVAITAEPWEGMVPITRRGAKPGDTLYVTGKLGGSLSAHHLDFTPRIQEARTIASSLGPRLHAMMDISDGLSIDLWRMCQASRTGAILDESQLDAVVRDDARRAAPSDGRSPLVHVLGDGEDFELLLAVEGKADVPGVPLYAVGIMAEEGFRLRSADGRCQPLEPQGYVH